MWKIVSLFFVIQLVSLCKGQLEACNVCLGFNQASPDDRFDVENKKMLFIHQEENFVDALTKCEKFGMRLLTPETARDSKSLSEYLNERVGGFRFWNLWLSMTDEKSEGNFTWATTQQAVKYSNWPEGEPNGGTNENCVELNWSNAGGIAWNDCACSGKRRFICEKDGAAFNI